MNDEQIFTFAMQFLARTDLKGSEALAMANVLGRLEQLAKTAATTRRPVDAPSPERTGHP